MGEDGEAEVERDISWKPPNMETLTNDSHS